ncbi:Response regulator [uncultured Gammaproteobacteria bacterium]
MNKPEIDYGQFTALVVEDQPFVRRTIITILRQIGFRTLIEAEHGEAGLAACVTHNPDIVICDIEMKPVDGLGFLKGLRANTQVRNPRTPVVFLTNHGESEVVKQAMSLGVNAFVVKPPVLAKLKERIDRLLGG